jgi:hypothetical protein
MSARTAKAQSEAQSEAQSGAPTEFLERYAREVDTLAADLDAFQDVLCRLLDDAKGRSADGSGQALDEMAQRARALADVARSMAKNGASSPVEHLTADVKLDDVLQRLSGSESGSASAGANGGKLEFF